MSDQVNTQDNLSGSQDEEKRASNSVSSWKSPDFTMLWVPILVLLVLLLGIPLAWLFIAQRLGFPLSPISDIGGLLAIVGGVMGAIFTVGGLVIALVAILTQISLRERAQREIKEATKKIRKDLERQYREELRRATDEEIPNVVRKSFEEKYEQLRPELDNRVNQQVRGHLLFQQALELADQSLFDVAEILTKSAIRLYPELDVGQLGVKMSKVLIAAFKPSHGIALGGIPADYVNSEHEMSRFETPSPVQAIHWLELAQKHHDTPEAIMEAMLALMHGLSKNYVQMMACMKQALEESPDVINYFREPLHLCILAHGCLNEPDQRRALKKVGEALDMELPVQDEAVRHSILIATHTIYWIVIGQRQAWMGQAQPNFPIPIWISGHEEGDIRVGKAFYSTPNATSATAIPLDEKDIPISQLMKELTDRFLFLYQEHRY